MAETSPVYGTDGGKADPADSGLEGTRNSNLEVSMWRLSLSGEGSADAALPERPGEPDCGYFLRTGGCGYGDRCRYNHPRDRAAGLAGGRQSIGSDYPERLGQPICQYYMKHGTCKFGANCKYHHPRQDTHSVSMNPVILNTVGYPVRPGEKDCSYYMRTGQCKFGYTCKFHHPELGSVPAHSPALGVLPTIPPSSYAPLSQFPPLTSWQFGRSAVLPGPFIPGSYSPMLVSPGVAPFQSWTSFVPPLNSGMPVSSQQAPQAGPMYGISHLPYTSGVAPHVSTISTARSLSSNEHDNSYPERPGQPECQHYVRTGDCKFGETCKYHHPRDGNVPKSSCFLSPLGLPIRPGAQPCNYYAQHGYCRFGPTCKFDHPVGTISYSPSASSLTEMPVAPYPLSYSIANFNSSSSSPELRQEYLLTQEASAQPLVSPEAAASGSAVSRGISAPPRSFICSQTPTFSGTGNTTHC